MLISFDNLSCILPLIYRMNHLIMCSSNNILYILDSSEVQSSCWFYHLYTRGWVYVKLGDVDACKMHIWSLHFTTWYSTLFASYIGYVHAFWWLLGIIHMFPNFIRLTWENQKTSFSMFLTFRDPNRVQITRNFGGTSFSTEQDLLAKEMQQGSHEGQTGMAHTARFPAPMGPTRSPLLLRCRRSLSRWMCLDLRPPIKRAPCGWQKGAPPKHRNTKQKPGRSKIGGENSGGPLPVWSPSPPTTLPSLPWWRRSSSPLDYGFVAVAICISLLFFIVLAPYELHNMIMAMFVSLLWWIFPWVIYEIAIVL
jgi:hypothetical protein